MLGTASTNEHKLFGSGDLLDRISKKDMLSANSIACQGEKRTTVALAR